MLRFDPHGPICVVYVFHISHKVIYIEFVLVLFGCCVYVYWAGIVIELGILLPFFI